MKNLSKHFNDEFVAHLEAIKEAKEKFEANENTSTATVFSNLKYNSFRTPEECFNKKYLKKLTKKAIKDFNKDLDKPIKPKNLVIKTKNIYKPTNWEYIPTMVAVTVAKYQKPKEPSIIPQ